MRKKTKLQPNKEVAALTLTGTTTVFQLSIVGQLPIPIDAVMYPSGFLDECMEGRAVENCFFFKAI